MHRQQVAFLEELHRDEMSPVVAAANSRWPTVIAGCTPERDEEAGHQRMAHDAVERTHHEARLAHGALAACSHDRFASAALDSSTQVLRSIDGGTSLVHQHLGPGGP